jgi:arylformamidase
MLYDITPLVSPRLATFPGDTPLSREILLDMNRGDHVTLSALRATVHLGAHADAPSHYGKDAPAMHAVDLARFIGPCQVLHLNVPRGQLISPDAIRSSITSDRLLLATGTYPDPNHFNTDFAGLSPDFVDFLHDQGVRLVGVDTPSVDPFDSKDMAAHKRFLAHDMYILETLLLSGVPEGMYELIALPLRLEGFEASPVRAVLRRLEC